MRITGSGIIGRLGVLGLALALLGTSAFGSPFAYIPNRQDNTVSVIDLSTNAVVATIGMPVLQELGIEQGVAPNTVAVSPDGTRVYVTTVNPNPRTDGFIEYFPGNVVVIDGTTNALLPNPGNGGYPTLFNTGGFPAGVAFTPSGNAAYVAANGGYDGFTVFPPEVDPIVAGVPSAAIPMSSSGGIAIEPTGARAYVVGRFSHDVTVIDLATKTVLTGAGLPIQVGLVPVSIAISPTGIAYVPNSTDGTVSVISTVTNTVTATIQVGTSPLGVAVEPSGAFAWITNSGDDTVSVIDTAMNAVVGTPIMVGHHPTGIAFSPGGNLAYVGNEADGTVTVIATATRAIVGDPIPVGNLPSPFGQFIMPTPPAVAPPTRFAVYPARATVNQPFAVVVQAQDVHAAPQKVTLATSVTLSRNAGTGILGGTLGCTIPAGGTSCTMAAVTYSVAERGVVLAVTRSAGDVLPSAASAPFRVFPVPPTNLGVTSVNGGADPIAGKPFDVVVQSQNPAHGPVAVILPTTVTLSVAGGSGMLGGGSGCTIAADATSCTIVGVTYSKAEYGVALTATRTAGDAVVPGTSAPFTVDSPASPTTRLVITNLNGGTSPVTGATFNVTVQLQDATGTPVNSASGDGVLLMLKKGSGLFGGNRTCTITAGTSGCTASATYTLGDPSMPESGIVINASRASNPSLYGSGDSAPFTVTGTGGGGSPPTQLSVAPVTFFDPSEPAVGVPFDVAVFASAPGVGFRPVTAATALTLSLHSGTGTLGGNLGCTIMAGGAGCTVSGVTYSKAEANVSVTATRTSGDVLAAGNGAAFTVHAAAAPTHLAITRVGNFGPTAASVGVPFTVSVVAEDAAGIVQTVGVATGVTLSVNTGTGSLSGTTGCTIAAGTAGCTVSGVTYSKAESGIVLTATRTSGATLSAGNSGAFAIVATPTKLVFTSVNAGTDPLAGFAFFVFIQSSDATDASAPVTSATTVALGVHGGFGTLGGNTTCSIPAGSSSCSISGVTYSQAESNVVLSAVRTGGDPLATGLSPAFVVDAPPPVPPSKLAIVAVNGGANPGVGAPFDVVVQAQDGNGLQQGVASSTAVTLSLHVGTGNLGGGNGCTIAPDARSCTVVGVTYSKAEAGVVLRATRTGGDVLALGDSAAFTVGASGSTTTSTSTSTTATTTSTTTTTTHTSTTTTSGSTTSTVTTSTATTTTHTTTTATVTTTTTTTTQTSTTTTTLTVTTTTHASTTTTTVTTTTNVGTTAVTTSTTTPSSTSTTTASTTTTSTVASTTTTSPGCPTDATVDADVCRTKALSTLVSGADLGPLQKGLGSLLDRALQKEQLAADATSPKARARALKDAIRAVIGFVHRLGSQAARHHVSANTRQMLRQLAVGLHTDLVGLRSKS